MAELVLLGLPTSVMKAYCPSLACLEQVRVFVVCFMCPSYDLD
jgi:hypothetical protein